MPALVEFKYISDTKAGITGHTVHAISPQHLEEILQRYYIGKDQITWARVDRSEIAPEYLREYVHHIFKLKNEKGGKKNEF